MILTQKAFTTALVPPTISNTMPDPPGEFPPEPLMVVTKPFTVTSADPVDLSPASMRHLMIAPDAESWEVSRSAQSPWKLGDSINVPLTTNLTTGFARAAWERVDAYEAQPKLFAPLTRLAHETERPAELLEVIHVFQSLFTPTRSDLLPGRTVIVPYMPDACYINLKDNTPPWEEAEPDKDGGQRNFSEIFLDEICTINGILPTSFQAELLGSLPRRQLEQTNWLPDQMRNYEDWIACDLIRLIEKRLAFGARDSLLEDVFRIYSAGYFPCGWSGSYPDDVHLLAFAGAKGK